MKKPRMNTHRTKTQNTQADPRLVWLATVLAAAVFVVFVTQI